MAVLHAQTYIIKGRGAPKFSNIFIDYFLR